MKRRPRGCTAAMLVMTLFSLLPAAASAQARIYFDDWRSTPAGATPSSVRLVRGGAVVTDWNGGRYLRVESRTDLEIVFPGTLPGEFIIEFEMVVPSSRSYPVEIRAAVPGEGPDYRGATLRQQRATAHCGAIAAGVYGVKVNRLRSPDAVAATRVPCRVHVAANRIEVRYADRPPVAVDDIDFGRTDRIRLTVPAIATEVAYIGAIAITSPSPDASRIAVRPEAERQLTSADSPTLGGTTIGTPIEAAGTGPVTSKFASAASHARAQYAAGVAATTTGAELRQQFGLTTELAASTLKDAGYTIPQIAAWLKTDGRSADAAAGILASLGASPAEVYDVLTQTWAMQRRVALKTAIDAGVPLEALVAVLKQKGMTYEQVGPDVLAVARTRIIGGDVLRKAYNATDRMFVRLLKDTGASVREIVVETVDVYGVVLGRMFTMLREVGFAPRDIVKGVWEVTSLPPRQAMEMLVAAGFSLELSVDAVMHNYTLGVETMIQVLRQLAYSPLQVMMLVQKAYKQPMLTLFPVFLQAGYNLQEVFTAMKQANVSDVQALKAARDAGYLAGSVLHPFLVVFATVPTAAGHLAADRLIKAGYTPEQTAAAMKAHFNESALWVGQRLSDAGLDGTSIRNALMFAFSLTLEAALAVLAAMGK